jgi:hypothetical protein
MESVSCQNDGVCSFSEHVPGISVRASQALWLLKKEGVVATFRQICGFLMRRILAPFRTAPPASAKPIIGVPDANLDLQAGEWVEVMTKEEILKTVDSDWRTRGLQLVPEMRDYFGRRLRVMKRVQKICVEDTEGNLAEVRSLKNTVLLEGAMCKGGGVGCDRSCHYF